MTEINQYTVIFLTDKIPPKHILMLKRAETKSFAPGYYTGIGGKVGDHPNFANETVLEGAYRELREETLEELSFKTTSLTEFARFHYQHGLDLHYFAGIHPHPDIPAISLSDGILEWVRSDMLLNKKIIPTTKIVCQIWEQNDYRLNPFTVIGREIGMNLSVRIVETVEILKGLQSFHSLD